MQQVCEKCQKESVEETADFYNENDEEQTDQSNSHASEDDDEDEFQPKVISGDCLDEFSILNNYVLILNNQKI